MVYSYLYIITALAIIIFSQNRTCTKSLVYKIFDSIDFQIEITPLSFQELSRTRPGESSADCSCRPEPTTASYALRAPLPIWKPLPLSRPTTSPKPSATAT